MKMTRMKKNVSKGIIALCLLLFLAASVHAAPEYLDLQAGGDDMAPTIRKGDTVRVKICTDGSLIKVGPLTNADPGDIIVYCAGAVVSLPAAMWTCGRAISKRFENGQWYFKTKMDNASDPDSWEVPGYALLGIVVNVVHAEYSQNTAPAPEPSETPSASETSSQGGPSPFVFDMLVGVAFGVVLGFGAKEALSRILAPHPRLLFFHLLIKSSSWRLA